MGGKTSTSSTSTQIPQEVLARYNAVNTRAEDVATQPFQNYSGEFVAPLNSTQSNGIYATDAYANSAQPAIRQAYGDVGQAVNTANPYYDSATNYAAWGAQPVNPDQLDIQRYMNPWVQNVADTTAKALNQQQQQAMSGQTGNAMRSGAFGGDRAGIAAAVQQRQNQQGMSQALAPIYAQGYQQALGTAQQQQGVGLGAAQANRAALQQGASTMAGIGGQRFNQGMQGAQAQAGLGQAAQTAGLQGAQAQLQAGGQWQQTQQAMDSAQYNQFLQQQGYPFQVAQFLANIAMGTGSLSGSTTTTTQPAPFFSDPRLKEDAHRIGKTDDGLPIYSFAYKGDPRKQTHIGLMADDVEKKRPEAVGLSNGYKTVDYAAATKPKRAFGGMVMEPGSYAEGGLASGIPAYRSLLGSPGASRLPPEILAALAQPQKHQMLQHAPPPKPIQSEMSQLMGAGQQAADLGKLATGAWDTGKKGLDWLGSQSGGMAYGGMVPDGFASGGGVGDGIDPYDMPDSTDFMSSVLKAGKIDQRSLPKPGEPPKPPQSGLGQALGAAKDIAGLYSTASTLGTMASGAGSTLSSILPFFLLARGGGVRPRYADGGTIADYSEEADKPAVGAIEDLATPETRAEGIALAREAARKHGIDPNNFTRVLAAESSWDPSAIGDNGSSGGYAQMHVAGISPKYAKPGLGDTYFAARQPELADKLTPQQKIAYLADPKNQPDVVDYAAEHASKNGLGAWTTARNMGLAGNNPSGIRPPGEIRLPQQPKEGGLSLSPPLTYDQKQQSMGDFLTSKDFILPLLSGLGKMASSNSRYLGSAVLQGVGGAAETYAALQNQQTEQQLKRAQTQNTLEHAGLTNAQQNIERLKAYGFDFVRGYGWVNVDRSDPKNPIITVTHDQNGNPIPPRRISQSEYDAGRSNAPAGTTAAPVSTPPVQTTAVDEKGVKPKPDVVPETAPEYAKPLPSGWNATTSIPKGFRPSDQFALAKDPNAAKIGEEELKAQRQKFMGASSQLLRLDEMKRDFARMNESKWLEGGAMNDARIAWANEINTLAGMVGAKLAVDPGALGAAQSLQKNQFRLGTDLVQGLGREPGFILDRAVSANPSGMNNAQGYARITAGMEQVAQREMDLANFMTNYWKETGHTIGSLELFNRLNPPERYVERAILGTIPDFRQEYHRQYIATHPKPADRIVANREFDKEFGGGSSKIVMGQ